MFLLLWKHTAVPPPTGALLPRGLYRTGGGQAPGAGMVWGRWAPHRPALSPALQPRDLCGFPVPAGSAGDSAGDSSAATCGAGVLESCSMFTEKPAGAPEMDAAEDPSLNELRTQCPPELPASQASASSSSQAALPRLGRLWLSFSARTSPCPSLR